MLRVQDFKLTLTRWTRSIHKLPATAVSSKPMPLCRRTQSFIWGRRVEQSCHKRFLILPSKFNYVSLLKYPNSSLTC
jgi:hypothetical protein